MSSLWTGIDMEVDWTRTKPEVDKKLTRELDQKLSGFCLEVVQNWSEIDPEVVRKWSVRLRDLEVVQKRSGSEPEVNPLLY